MRGVARGFRIYVCSGKSESLAIEHAAHSDVAYPGLVHHQPTGDDVPSRDAGCGEPGAAGPANEDASTLVDALFILNWLPLVRRV